ncbi:MAG: VWA domain-containing protein [Flavobacteriales bacterium]|nr:VWA domain-containing protein [Flavobacteriales bacterium]
MKRTWKTIGCWCLLALTACVEPTTPTADQPDTDIENADALSPAPEPGKKSKIKLAILLDTSGSMDGLIEQAKNQLWKIVNQLAKAKDKMGEDPEIEIALYQYGNDGLSITNGYVQKISGFTSELDDISEQLFALQTNGGSEYCGTVIKTSIEELKWSDSHEDLQFIFIAGNEEFTQGDISYYDACKVATNKNVIINTIFCGNYQEGINTNWQDGAIRGNGKYMNIDSDAQIVHISSPYDKQISALNTKLNDTYIPYGSKGFSKKANQVAQDNNASSYGSANSTKRIVSKSSKVYKNKSWDLVDASDEKNFKIEGVDESTLPEEMKGMTSEEKSEYVLKKKDERLKVKAEIGALNKQRESYVAKEKAKNAAEGQEQLDDAIINAIIDQATSKEYTFEGDIN